MPAFAPSTTKKSTFRRITYSIVFVVVGVLLAVSVLALWMGTYPDNEDPKNLYYVLWKHGLNGNMNLDNAVRAMTHDSGSEERVIGLTRKRLEERFGYVRTPEQVSSYLRECYTGDGAVRAPGDRNKEVVFLRNSQYMVVLNDAGTAVDLVLCKGY